MGATGLLISEEFFLLWLAGRSGRDYRDYAGFLRVSNIGDSPRRIDQGLAGAMLDDLFLAGRLSFDAAGRVVADPTPTGDATLDVLLATIADAGKPHALENWISRLLQAPCVERVGDLLAARGIMARTEHRALGVFKVKHYALLDSAARERVVVRLRTVVLGDVEPDIGTAMLLSLLQECGGMRWLLTPEELRWSRERIAEIVAGDEVAAAIRSLIASRAE